MNFHTLFDLELDRYVTVVADGHSFSGSICDSDDHTLILFQPTVDGAGHYHYIDRPRISAWTDHRGQGINPLYLDGNKFSVRRT